MLVKLLTEAGHMHIIRIKYYYIDYLFINLLIYLYPMF